MFAATEEGRVALRTYRETMKALLASFGEASADEGACESDLAAIPALREIGQMG